MIICSVAGGATHGGGSCQISLSYDRGASFHVIHSMVGGCPLKSSYEFTIPSDAPSCDNALFAWSWLNEVGNREFYMNCALVKITGSSSGTSLNTPLMFEANIFGEKCTTPEGLDFVYPNPGNSVEYGGKYSSQKPTGPTEITGCPSLDYSNSPPSSQDLNSTVVEAPPVGAPSEAPSEAPSASASVQNIPTSSPNAQPTYNNGQYQQPTYNNGQYQQPTPSIVQSQQAIPSNVQLQQQTPSYVQSQQAMTSTPVGQDQQPTSAPVGGGAVTETQLVFVTVTRTSLDYMTRPRTSPTGSSTVSDKSTVESCNEPGTMSCSSDGKSLRFCDENNNWYVVKCGENETCKDGKLIYTL